MAIYLGNLSVSEIENKAKVVFPKELVDYMSQRQQDVAEKVQPGKWHCFDIPFVLVCGDMETAKEIYKHLSPISADFQQKMQISVSNK